MSLVMPHRVALPCLLLFAACCSCVLANEPPQPTRMDYTIDTTWSLDDLIDELRDDDVRWNARDAVTAIMSYPTSPVERLQQALDDPDWQVRQIACDLLWSIRETYIKIQSDNEMVRFSYARWRPEPGSPRWRFQVKPPITDRLIAVTIDGLRNDATPYDHSRRRALMYTNAVHGLSRLVPIAHTWQNELEAALDSDDAQQQLLAAIILGMGGVSDSAELASPILLPHLRDNDIKGDARVCLLALMGFGESVMPQLRSAFFGADTQQRDLLTLLILDITDPPVTEADRVARSRFNSITTIVHDPAVEAAGTSQWSWLDALK